MNRLHDGLEMLTSRIRASDMQNFDLLKYWPVIVSIVAIVSGYAIFGYRVSALEHEMGVQSVRISALETDTTTFKVQFVSLQKDIDYMKVGIDDIRMAIRKLPQN